MKNGKAAGEDGIALEFFKYMPKVWLEKMSMIINRIFRGEKLVKGWKIARIYPIFKDGDESEVKTTEACRY